MSPQRGQGADRLETEELGILVLRTLRKTLDRPFAWAAIGVTIGLLVHHLTTQRESHSPPLEDAVLTEQTRPGGPERATSDHGPSVEDAVLNEQAPPPDIEGKPPLRFREVWAYLYRGEEDRWRPEMPITDLCLFNFGLDEVGHVEGQLDTPFLQKVQAAGVRAHLVVASSGKRSLFHFLLEPRYGVTERVVSELVDLAERYPAEGLQLDFEGLRPEDRQNLVSFIRRLRDRLRAGCILSLALPAKTKTSGSAYHYRDLRELVDRCVIMAYDFHWKGGPPGSISPRDWHDRVVAHALKELPRTKVVIALPFYGRIWQKSRVARATRYAALDEYLRRKDVAIQYDADGSHRFTFTEVVEAEGWFEDAASLYAKLESSWRAGVRAVGFWRLGQEDPRVWEPLRR